MQQGKLVKDKNSTPELSQAGLQEVPQLIEKGYLSILHDEIVILDLPLQDDVADGTPHQVEGYSPLTGELSHLLADGIGQDPLPHFTEIIVERIRKPLFSLNLFSCHENSSPLDQSLSVSTPTVNTALGMAMHFRKSGQVAKASSAALTQKVRLDALTLALIYLF